MNGISEILAATPMIPVLTIHDLDRARIVAEALIAAGLNVLEVTLRTPLAYRGITELAALDGAIVGAGTVLNASDLDAAVNAGARFAVSPGLTEPLACAAIASATPYLPGVATASDIMRALDLGLTHFKFFPAEASGGIATLSALSAAFAAARFCPTGGITLETAPRWFALDTVTCVGMSWMAPDGSSSRADTERAARSAAELLRDCRSPRMP